MEKTQSRVHTRRPSFCRWFIKLPRPLTALARGTTNLNSWPQTVGMHSRAQMASKTGPLVSAALPCQKPGYMVAPGFLQSHLVRQWLGGILPAWTLLDQDSFIALRQERTAPDAAIRVRDDVTEADLIGSIMVRNTTTLLQQAVEIGGLRLTANGNLTRATVAELIPQMEWPGFNKADMYRYNRVINESDFVPLHIVRVNAAAARLLRVSRGRLVATKSGREMLSSERKGHLLAQLFSAICWKQSLSDFSHGLLGGWPLQDIGVVLWSLCVSATDWQSPEALARLCTIPINGVLEADWDVGSTAIEARILRPLLWLGLIEHRQEGIPGSRFGSRHFYRKTQLFDTLIKFNVTLEAASGSIQ